MSKRSRRQERILLGIRWYHRFIVLRRRCAFVLRPMPSDRAIPYRKYYLPRFGLR